MLKLCSRTSETLALPPSLDRMGPELQGWQSIEANFSSPTPLWTPLSTVGARQPSLVDTLDWFAPPNNESAPLASAFDSNTAPGDAFTPLEGQLTWSEADIKSSHTAPLNTAQSAPDHGEVPQTLVSDVNRASVGEESNRPAATTGSRYTTERKLLKNREAQKRYYHLLGHTEWLNLICLTVRPCQQVSTASQSSQP